LNYRITLRDERKEKNIIDDIRIRNGNLTIISGRIPENKDEL
jgi:hypothetical protein